MWGFESGSSGEKLIKGDHNHNDIVAVYSKIIDLFRTMTCWPIVARRLYAYEANTKVIEWWRIPLITVTL